MAFERPCLVFADSDGNIYDDPELHMLSMDAGGLGLPRPEDITPLPEHCPMALLPNRNALGLDPSTGDVEVHEGTALAALVPENYVVTGVPAAYREAIRPDAAQECGVSGGSGVPGMPGVPSVPGVASESGAFGLSADSGAPDVPPMAYAAVGFAHDRFYMCAKKIDDGSRFSSQGVAAKKVKKAAKAVKALYPGNRLVAHLIEQCALNNNCWRAKNFCLGLPEMFLPTHPSSCCNNNNSSNNMITNEPAFSAQSNALFEPTPEELAEVMLHHAKSAANPTIVFGHTCDHTRKQKKLESGNSPENIDTLTVVNTLEIPKNPDTVKSMHTRLTKALKLFKDKGGKATTILHIDVGFLPDLEQFAEAGLSGICYKLSCYPRNSREQLTKTSGNDQRTGCYLHVPNDCDRDDSIHNDDRPDDNGHNDTGGNSVGGGDKSTVKSEVNDPVFPHSLFAMAKTLGLQRILHYEYFPGLSDTENELTLLVTLLQTHSIGHLLLSNLPADPQKLCQSLPELDRGPVVGCGNFFKRIKKECPFVSIVSATPFYENG